MIVLMVRVIGGWQFNIYAEAGNNDNIYQRRQCTSNAQYGKNNINADDDDDNVP